MLVRLGLVGCGWSYLPLGGHRLEGSREAIELLVRKLAVIIILIPLLIVY